MRLSPIEGDKITSGYITLAFLRAGCLMRGGPRGGRSNGPYADSLPLSNQFRGGGGGGLGLGGGLGRLKGRGPPGPQHIWLKMTPSSR